jgi:hypothetical protein
MSNENYDSRTQVYKPNRLLLEPYIILQLPISNSLTIFELQPHSLFQIPGLGSKHLLPIKMATFKFLPLELRNMIYDYALSTPHDIPTNGLPPLYKVHPAITKELYTYRKTVTTVRINRSSPYPASSPSEEPPLLQTRLLALVNGFNEKANVKGIVVVFRAIPLPSRPIEQGIYGRDLIYAIMERIDAAFRGIDDVLTESKAMFWAMEFKFLGVETKVAGSRHHRKFEVLAS